MSREYEPSSELLRNSAKQSPLLIEYGTFQTVQRNRLWPLLSGKSSEIVEVVPSLLPVQHRHHLRSQDDVLEDMVILGISRV